MSGSTSDFDAAKSISDLLKDMDKNRQERVLRWVAESLEITFHMKATTPHDMAAAGIAGGRIGASVVTPHAAGRAADIKSFVELKNPKSDTQFGAVVAYYYRFEAPLDDRRDNISATVLQDAARLAGRTRFPTPLVTLNNAKKQGYLDTAERGSFKINSVGENLVAMTLPGSENGTKPKRKKRTKPPKTAKKRRAK